MVFVFLTRRLVNAAGLNVSRLRVESFQRAIARAGLVARSSFDVGNSVWALHDEILSLFEHTFARASGQGFGVP